MTDANLTTSQKSWTFLRLELEKYFNQVISKNNKELMVLEVGCGMGILIKPIAKKNPKIKFTGLDMDSTKIKEASKEKIGNLNFICEDILKFKTDEKYDIVITSEVLEHIEEPEKFLSKISSLTKGNGFLIISTPNRTNYPKVWFGFVFGKKADKMKKSFAEKNKKPGWKDKGHISVQGADELKRKLKKAGFIIKDQTRSQPLYGGQWVDSNLIVRNLNILIDKILPRKHFINWGWDLIFLAKKE
ncbi:MAG: methyltransferase domain-containing protein [Candidatus Diapherotrites archaeon]